MRLIDADKIHPDVRTQHGGLAISQGQLAYAETVNAILIPDNATNGDIIKAIYSISRIEDAKDGYLDVYGLDECKHEGVWISKEWWNAPYKGGTQHDTGRD